MMFQGGSDQKDGESRMEDEINSLTINCAIQHIATFYKQADKEEQADFGEPCANCPVVNECDSFNWIANLKPLFVKTEITINDLTTRIQEIFRQSV